MKSIELRRLKFWNQFKGLPFNVNMLLFLVFITLSILFTVFSNPFIKIAILLPFSFTMGMVSVPAVEFIYSVFSIIKIQMKLDEAKPIYSSSLMEEITTISSRMKAKKKDNSKIKIVSDWINAAMTGNGSMFLGQPIVEEFETYEREGIIGHELGHQQGKHHIKRILLLALTTPLYFYLIQLPFPILLNYLLIFAAIGLTMPLISWPFEFQADSIAAKCVGTEKIIAGLMKLATKADIDINQDSYTHPSIARRISRLRKKSNRGGIL